MSPTTTHYRQVNGTGASHGKTVGLDELREVIQGCKIAAEFVTASQADFESRKSIVEQALRDKVSELDEKVARMESAVHQKDALLNDLNSYRTMFETLYKPSEVQAFRVNTSERLDDVQERLRRLEQDNASMAARLATSSTSTAAVSALGKHVISPAGPSTHASHHHHQELENGAVRAQATARSPAETAADVSSSTVLSNRRQSSPVLQRPDKSGHAHVASSREYIPPSTRPSFPRYDFTKPVVDKSSFSHRKDFYAAWQSALMDVQDNFAARQTHLDEEASVLQSDRDALQVEALRVKKMDGELEKERKDIAETKALLQDHEEELLDRLGICEEREAALKRKEESAMHNHDRGGGGYERQAQEYSRIQELKDMKKDLLHRMQILEVAEQDWCRKTGRHYVPENLKMPSIDDLQG